MEQTENSVKKKTEDTKILECVKVCETEMMQILMTSSIH